MDTRNKKLYPGEGIQRKQKAKELKPIEMPYYAKRKDTKKFLKTQFRKQKQAEEEQQKMLENVSAKRQRQLFGERQTMPTDPTLLQTMAARQTAIPGQQDIMKETFLQKLLTPQEFQKYKEDKTMKKTKAEAMEIIPQQQLQTLQNILATQPEQLQTLQNILATQPQTDNTESLLKQIRFLISEQNKQQQSTPVESKDVIRKNFENLLASDVNEFNMLVSANKLTLPKGQSRVRVINQLVKLQSQGKLKQPSAAVVGQGLKLKRGGNSIEGKGFFGDLFKKAKEKIIDTVSKDPIGSLQKGFELAQKGIKGAQEAKKVATQFGLIKPKPAPAPAAEQAKGSGLKRGRGRPRKNMKGGDFASHLLSSGFHTMFDPFIDKGKQFLSDPATQQAIGIYKDLTGSGLKKKGKNSNAHFKQALEEYKNIQGKQKATRRRVVETM